MMTARAESSVFWSGMSADICANRNNTFTGWHPLSSQHPAVFQAVCSDFVMHKGVHYHVMVDRYSNRPIVSRSTARHHHAGGAGPGCPLCVTAGL